MQQAIDVIAALQRRRETLCTVESLTGGLLCAYLTDVPGASAVVRGGIVAYTMDAKRDVVTVDADLLAEYGAVSAEAAVALAEKAREIFGTTWAISTTGVAGPAEQEGQPVGTVFVAAAGPSPQVLAIELQGDRHEIRKSSCERALTMLLGHLE